MPANADTSIEQVYNSLSLSGMIAPPAESPEQKTAREKYETERDDRRSAGVLAISNASTASGWSAVGGLEDENRYAMSSLMVTNPEAYARLRLNALADVRSSVNAVYNTTRAQFLDAGLTLAEAEKRATAAASHTRKDGMESMGAKFPMSNDNKLLGVQQKNTNKF